MKEYKIQLDFQGYSRGTVVFVVTAETEEAAKANWWNGYELGREIARDDTKKEYPRVIEYSEAMKDQKSTLMNKSDYDYIESDRALKLDKIMELYILTMDLYSVCGSIKEVKDFHDKSIEIFRTQFTC